MPILNVKVSAQRSAEMTQKISATLLELTVHILGKDPKMAAIAIDYVDPQDWVVGEQALTAQGKNSVYFDIKVADEADTRAKKVQYIAGTFTAFAKLLDNLHEESYIYVQDVRATAYGYGGKTQEYRYQHT